MGLFRPVQKLAQHGIHKLDLDRLLQDNFDYNLLLKSLPEAFLKEPAGISRHWNLKGSVCVDLGHSGVIYGYTFPSEVRFHSHNHFLPVKLGKTDKLDPLRDRIWDQSSPDYPQLLFMVTVPETKIVEDALKAYYKPFNREKALGTEWFDISPSNAVEIALWISVLAATDSSLSSGELNDLARFKYSEPLLKLGERQHRLKEVRNAIKSIDLNFNAQGDNFKLGEAKGRGLACKGRPEEALTQQQYPVKSHGDIHEEYEDGQWVLV